MGLRIVIFGASGDLTRRKLIPALYNLYLKERLRDNFRIIGVSRRDWSDRDFRDYVATGENESTGCVVRDDDTWARFSSHVHFCRAGFTEESDFHALKGEIEKGKEGDVGCIYYLATPPALFEVITAHLHGQGMLDEGKGWRRVVVEKPFGNDLTSARALNGALQSVLKEDQIYRIDHYLGKETVQNVLVFRFGNIIFEPIWNRNFIDHVQITVAETMDVGHRAGYYDRAGVLRDMFQNHMLQMLTLVAMEPPASFHADAIRNEKVKLLTAIRPFNGQSIARDTVRGQYEGYRGENGVAADSDTPTFAALRLFIDNWRWKGVPFYLRSGKALKSRKSEIIIHFKDPPHLMFPVPEGYRITPNTIAICVQPNEGIHLEFEAKVPDTPADMRSVKMDFRYAESFGRCIIPEAYERLLLDVILGDASLFTRSDGIEMQWRFIDSIIAEWSGTRDPPLETYPRGSWGPHSADELLARDGREWLQACEA